MRICASCWPAGFFDQGADLVLHGLGQVDAGFAKRGGAQDRVLQGLADLDRGGREIAAERLRHVEDHFGGGREDVLADRREREQHALHGQDVLVGVRRQLLQRRGHPFQVADEQAGRAPGGADPRLDLRLRMFLGAGGLHHLAERGAYAEG